MLYLLEDLWGQEGQTHFFLTFVILTAAMDYHLDVILESADYRADLTAVTTAVTAVTATKAPLAPIRSALFYYPVRVRLSNSSELLRNFDKNILYDSLIFSL
jgi:hypothetical protein